MNNNREILLNQLAQIDNNNLLLFEIRRRFANRIRLYDLQPDIQGGGIELPILGSLRNDRLFQVSMNLLQEFHNEQVMNEEPPVWRRSGVADSTETLNSGNEFGRVYIIPIERLKTKVKTLCREEMESILPDVCGICLDNHMKKETIICCCNHTFGRECFKNWKKICNINKKDLTCPSCRQNITHITKFRIRHQPLYSPISIPPNPSPAVPIDELSNESTVETSSPSPTLNIIEYY